VTAVTATLVGLLVLAALWTMQTRILRAVLGLGVVSVLTTLLIFQMGAPLAGAFELSVCAGLITVVFASTVSMIRPAEPAEQERRRSRQVLRVLLAAGLLLAAGGVALLMHRHGVSRLAPALPGGDDLTSQQVLWSTRRLDLVGLLAIVLVGVFGVVVLFKEQPEKEDHS
jgi:NADH-quinone oxidoreductase subunit J